MKVIHAVPFPAAFLLALQCAATSVYEVAYCTGNTDSTLDFSCPHGKILQTEALLIRGNTTEQCCQQAPCTVDFCPGHAENLNTCTEQNAKDGSISVNVPAQVKRDLCGDQDPAVTNDKMQDQCSAFCAIGGLPLGLPLLMGSESFGFNKDQMEDICLNTKGDSFLEHDRALYNECKEKSFALRQIEEKAADFVAYVDILKLEILWWRTAAQEKSRSLQTELASPTFKKEMRAATNKTASLKAAIDRSEWKVHVSTNVGSGDLERAVDKVAQGGESLRATVNTQVVIYEEFLRDCNKLFTAEDQNKYFMLDICAQGNEECIEVPEAIHVGCCCGVNPLALELTHHIDGKMPTRRLTDWLVDGTGVSDEDQGIDDFSICAESKKRSSAGIAAATARLQSMSHGSEALQQYNIDLQEAHPEYTSQCGSGRSLRRLGEDQTGIEKGADRGTTNNKTSTGERTAHPASARKLQTGTKLQCNPTSSKTEDGDLLVEFTDRTRLGLCQFDPTVTEAQMQQQCDAFCEPHGVPITMGTEEFGFDLSQMESIILSPRGGLLTHDTAELEQCMSDRNAFREILVRTASFIEKLDVFLAAKMFYTGQTQAAVEDLKRYVQTAEFARNMAEAPNKLKTFKDALESQVAAKMNAHNSAAQTKLEAGKEGLKAALSNLDSTLTQELPKLQRFLKICNKLYVAVGPRQEYLLDICAQESTACIEETDSRTHSVGHVGCSCGFNPVTTIGFTDVEYPIAGVAGVDSRRLQLQDITAEVKKTSDLLAPVNYPDDDQIDICGTAWEAARFEVARINQETQALGQAAVLDDYERRMAVAYGNEYCSYAFVQLPPPTAPPTARPTAHPTTSTSTLTLDDLEDGLADGSPPAVKFTAMAIVAVMCSLVLR
mmetsp:Transcript_14534/g.25555  ORF Transcript_14534/g.25555 Transcript_14534/m.25555 type:complete len:890 (+) Transcript_14534:85-2754(+)